MKIFLRKSLSFLLALALVSSLSMFAAASDALGEDLTAENTAVNQSTTLSTNVFWSTSYSDLRTENLITYAPNTAVTPIVTYGGVLTSCNTISATAKALEAQGYRVVAGLNGDFYNTSTGLPIGLVVSNGQLRSTDAGYYAIGFRADGTAVLGKPAVKVTADLGYAVDDGTGTQTQVVRTLTAVNKARVSTGGIYLYTYDFNSRHTTGNTEEGVDVLCTIESGSLSIGGTVTLRVDSITQTTSATAIGPNQVVLSANVLSSSYYTSALLKAPTGGTITLNVSAAEGWNGVQNAVGALYSLVQNGSVVSGLPSGSNPRTAVGQKADGTLVFYTIDGRQSGYSIGATMTQIAQRLVELGCVTALCLDGGGSTTLTVTQPDATAAKTVNKPSGGSERAVSNQIFLVAASQPSGVLDHFYVSADNDYVLAGSQVNLTASAVDTNFIPMATQTYTLSATAGTISGNTLVTPSSGGDVTVTASGSGGQSGSTVIHAIPTPGSITVRKGGSAVTSLTLTPGSSVALTASAVYNHLALAADAGAFTWSLSGSIGSVDASGKLTAATPGTGTLTVSAGGKTASVAVTVSSVALATVEDFETSVPTVTGYSYGAALSAASDVVKYGRRSGKLDYTLGSDGTATAVFDTAYPIGSAYTQLNLWVYGDNSGNQLALLTSDGTTTTASDIGVLNWTGWKQLTAVLPASASSVTGFRITGTADGTGAYPAPSGTLYLDQLVASYGGKTDDTAPVVTASLSGTALTASVSDSVDGTVPKSAVTVTVDGKAVDFTYNASAGTVTAAVSAAAGSGHRVTVTAKDASGNIGRASADIAAADAAPRFSDIAGYWGASYVNYLYTAGITAGYADGTFQPNRNITRQEFAVMLYRYLGLDGTQYESVQLPFADADKIGSFALPAVRALYAAGIISGTASGGKLWFYPGSNLTRAQAAAMIGRTQARGYASAALSFSDAASIPEYAVPYIQTMTAQGVIGGYQDGTFKPATNITRGQMAKILYSLL